MSGEKESTVVYDAALLRAQFEAILQREQERYDSLAGADLAGLSAEDSALVARVEARIAEQKRIEGATRRLQRSRVETVAARVRLARSSASSLMAGNPGLRLPALPIAPDPATLDSMHAEDLRTLADTLDISMRAYEKECAQELRKNLAKRASGIDTRHRNVGTLCYAADLIPKAEVREAAYAVGLRALLENERQRADRLLELAGRDEAFRPSERSLELYRQLLEESDVGALRQFCGKLESSITDDIAANYRDRQRIEALARETTAMEMRAALLDACKKMGWKVVIDRSDGNGEIYVAQDDFANHLRKLQLVGDASGGTTLNTIPVRINWHNNVSTHAALDEELKRFDLSFCSARGTMGKLVAELKKSSVAINHPRRVTSRAFASIDERQLPSRVRNAHSGVIQDDGKATLKEMCVGSDNDGRSL